MPGILYTCIFLLIVSAYGQQNQTESPQECVVREGATFEFNNASFGEAPLKTLVSTCLEETEQILVSEINSVFNQAQNFRRRRNKRSFVRRRHWKDRGFAKGRMQHNSKRTGSKELVMSANCHQQFTSIRVLRYPGSFADLEIQKKRTNLSGHESTGRDLRTSRRRSLQKRLIKEKRRMRVAGSVKRKSGRRRGRTTQRQTASFRASKLDNGSEAQSSFRVLSRNVDTRRAITTRRRSRRLMTGRRVRLQLRIKGGKASAAVNSFTRRRRTGKQRNSLRASRSRGKKKSLARRGDRRQRKSKKNTRKGNIQIRSNRQSNIKRYSAESKLLRKHSSSSKRKKSKRRQHISLPRISNQRFETATTGVVTEKELQVSNNINTFYQNNVNKGSTRSKNRKRRRKQVLRRRRNRIRHAEIPTNENRKNLDLVKLGDKFVERNNIFHLYLPASRESIKRFPYQKNRDNFNGVHDDVKGYAELIKQTGAEITIAKESKRSGPFAEASGHILGILGLSLWMTSRSTSS
ncbi:uncharacterized protein LOC133186245 [Saccostrea echinata]|uniref:uncharacterized protein LOC133186245 n=1 Tax=Saccostrea echinata TaxID=191078 RepID=UPI002A809882|nr:uncharacterized protein LOC133186245 [Saccostrea echinata]